MLRTENAAKKLGLKKSTLEAWRCRGGGPQFVKMGKAVLYRQEDLDAFVQAHLRKNTCSRAEV